MSSFPAVLARLRPPFAILIVLALLVAGLVFVAPATSQGAVASAASADCACAQIGGFSEPDPGTAPKVAYRTPTSGSSPRGTYDIEAGESSVTIYRAGDRTRPVYTQGTVGADLRWGFSPDDHRFAVWGVGAGNLFSWALYDLSTGTARQIASEQGLGVATASLTFSKGGKRFAIGYAQGSSLMTLKVYSATVVSAQPLYTEQVTLPFPPHDPGGGAGGEPGGPSVPRDVEAEVPKGTKEIHITWKDPTWPGDGRITSHILEVSPEAPPGAAIRTGDNPRHLIVSGMTVGQKYTFTLRITNSAGKKGVPVEVSAKIPLPKPAPTPSPTPTRPGVAADAVPFPAETAPASPEREPQATPSPQSDPSSEPTADPSVDPTADPSADPTTEPSSEPLADPSPVLPDPAVTPDPAATPGVPASADPASSEPAEAWRSAAHGLTAIAAAAPAVAAADEGGRAGWGFSPDDDERYLVFATTTSGAPRMKVVDLQAKKVTIDRSVTALSEAWSFSPCAGVLGIAGTTAGSGAFEVMLLDTTTGKQVGATVRPKIAPAYSFAVDPVAGGMDYVFVTTTAKETFRTRIAAVPPCQPGGEPDPGEDPKPPAPPTSVTATGASQRVLVSWQYGDGEIDGFEVRPFVDGEPLAAIEVSASQRRAVIGYGDTPAPAGTYSFAVVAIRDDLESSEARTTRPAAVDVAYACGVTWSEGPRSGTVTGLPAADGAVASFSWELNGSRIEIVDRSTASAERTVDFGNGGILTQQAGSNGQVTRVIYNGWGDYIVTMRTGGGSLDSSTATAVVHVVPPAELAVDDAFADASRVEGSSGTLRIETDAATCEPGEPGIDGLHLFTRWTVYTPTSSGTLLLEDEYSQVRAYTGSTLAGLTQVGEHQARIYNKLLQVPVVAGEPVYLQVTGHRSNHTVPRTYEGSWRLVAPLPHDDVAHAKPIEIEDGFVLDGDIAGATVQPGERCTAEDECNSTVVASVWYRWTAETDEYVWFAYDGSQVVPDLFVADASHPLGIAPAAAAVDKYTTNGVGVRQESGRDYFLRMSADESDYLYYGLTQRWEASVHPAPPNDLIENAQRIEGASGAQVGTNAWGHLEVFPDARPSYWSSIVWYEWTAPQGGSISFTAVALDGRLRYPEVYVFTPSDKPGADPELVAPAEFRKPASRPGPRTAFKAVEGERYLLAVTGIWSDGHGGTREGPFRLEWETATVPDAPADVTATPLDDGSGIELDWRAPADGNADITGYVVEAEPALPAHATVEVDRADSSAVVRGLTGGQEVTLRVAAVNTVGTGRFSAAPPATVPQSIEIAPFDMTVEPGAVVSQQVVATKGEGELRFYLSTDDATSWLEIDNQTGVLSGTAPDEPAAGRVVLSVEDAQGRSAYLSARVVVGDPPAPAVEVDMPSTPDGGWYGDDVRVVLTPGPSAPITARAATPERPAFVGWRTSGATWQSGESSDRGVIDIHTDGETIVDYWTAERPGGLPTTVGAFTVRIDRGVPTVSIVSPVSGATYAANAVPAPEFDCADALSGVVACQVVDEATEPWMLTPADERVLAVRATDAAGNTALARVAYRVSAAGDDPAPAAGGEQPMTAGADRPVRGGLPATRDGLAATGAPPIEAGLLAVGLMLAAAGLVLVRRRGARRAN
jgi:hypothetical protein